MTARNSAKQKTEEASEQRNAAKGRKKVPAQRTSGRRREDPAGEEKKVAFAKPGNFLYPVPAVMVSCAPKGGGRPNIITVAWAGTVCSDPPMVSISVRKERYSHDILKESGEFVINLTNKALAKACDYCGCRTGAKTDKFKDCRLTPGKSTVISAPTIEEAPVSLECKVKNVLELGSHDMFLAEVVAVTVDAALLDERGSFHMEDADLIAYAHGRYYALGKLLGTFGYSVKKAGSTKKTATGVTKKTGTGSTKKSVAGVIKRTERGATKKPVK